MATNENLIPIPGRLHSIAIEGHVAGADEIYDDAKGKTQDTINNDVDTAIGDDSTPESIKGRIKTLEVAIGEGGSVPAMVDEKINALDAEVSLLAGADGLSLSVSEVNGKLTLISGSIASNTYDGYGAADRAKEDLIGDAASDYNTLGKLEDKIQEEATTRQNAITDVIGDADSNYNTLGKLEARLQEEAFERTSADSSLDGRLTTVESKIPSEASQLNKLADKDYVNAALNTELTRATDAENLLQSNIEAELIRAEAAENSISESLTAEETRARAAELTNSDAIDAIEEKIPSQASVDNQLADKEFVNSGIATATATFRGTSATGLTEQEFLQWADNIAVKDNNDYIFWNTVDSIGNVQFKKYKYDGTNWIYEYTLNNSSFTAELWAAINSRLTSGYKTKIDGIEEGAQVNIIETISVNSTPLTPENKSIDIAVPTQLALLAEDTTHRVVTDTEKAAWNAKLGAVDDLQTIREGAALGATAYLKPNAGIPSSDMTPEVLGSLGKADSAYLKPQSGIPESDLDTSTQNKINAGNTAYLLPSGGIPKTDLDTNVLESLNKADTAILEHQSLENYYNKTQTDALLDQKQDALTIDSTPIEGSGNPISSDAVNTLKNTLENALDGKANKSELQITQGSGADADKATIQLKEGVSALVITQHLDISLKANVSDLATKVTGLINGTNGIAIIFNESDGGGAKFEHNDGTESYVGVNDGGESGIAALIYADKLVDGRWQGAKLDIKNTGIYYTVGNQSAAQRDVPANELATKGDIPTIPSDVSAFNNDAGYLVSSDISGKADKSDTYTKLEVDTKIDEVISGGADLQNYYTKAEVDSKLDEKADSSDLANVATSGDYDDLINKPSIPAALIQADWNLTDSSQLDYIKNKPDSLVYATVAEAEAVAYEMN